MKKLLLLIFLLICIFTFTGCENSVSENRVEYNFMNVKENEEGNIIINTKDITNEVTFVNYESDGIIIQFIVVRGTDGEIRIAFNTCQSCYPTPKGYFIQKGDYIECQSCGTLIHIDDIGISSFGCNPAPVEEKILQEDEIIISIEYINSYRDYFIEWNGPIE